MKTPGLKQWAEVRQMIRARNQEIAFVEEESARLKATELSLENSPAAQEREIRKVLGFVDQNEIVFEFDK